MPRNSSSAPVVVPPGLLIATTTPETWRASATRLNRSRMRCWSAKMKPSTATRAIWFCAARNGTRPPAAAPIATTARIAPRMPSTRQKDSLRRSRLRSAISSASIGIARILEKDASPRGGGTLGAACLRGKRSEQPLLRGWLRRLGREALSLLDRLLDRADPGEGRLGQVLVLAPDEAIDALDGGPWPAEFAC